MRPSIDSICAIVALLLGLNAPLYLTFAAEPIPGIGPVGQVVQLHTDFAFTEGPAADRDGNVYFSDIPNTKILKVDANGKLSVFTDQSRRANGLMFNAAGELVACEGDGQVVAWKVGAEKSRRVLVATHNGKQFNAPNDLVLDAVGGVYFTDPHFGKTKPLPQGKMAVYYVDANGKPTRLVDDLLKPNGILLSLDEKMLYVFPSSQPIMRAYPVLSPGKLGEGRDFCKLRVEGAGLQGADGATIDTRGNLYITSRLGVQVFAPNGKALGIIEFPEPPANVTFGGPEMKSLYVTARTSLYTVPMKAIGHRYPAGEK